MQQQVALSCLSEEEGLFLDSVLEFAEEEVRPHVRAMDHPAAMNDAHGHSR